MKILIIYEHDVGDAPYNTWEIIKVPDSTNDIVDHIRKLDRKIIKESNRETQIWEAYELTNGQCLI